MLQERAVQQLVELNTASIMERSNPAAHLFLNSETTDGGTKYLVSRTTFSESPPLTLVVAGDVAVASGGHAGVQAVAQLLVRLGSAVQVTHAQLSAQQVLMQAGSGSGLESGSGSRSKSGSGVISGQQHDAG